MNVSRSSPEILLVAVLLAAGAGSCAAGEPPDDNAPMTPPTPRELRNPDDRRPDEQYTVRLLGRRLTIGGEYEFEPQYRRDFAFDARGDDLFRVDQGIDLEFLYEWSPDLDLFLEGKYRRRDELYVEGGPEDRDSSLERGETWLYARRLAGGNWGLQVGRQNIHEKREWWWDEDLDALRLYYDAGAVGAELAVAEELAAVASGEDIDPERDDILRVLGRVTWNWGRRQRLEFFYLHHDDRSGTPVAGAVLPASAEDDRDADLDWYGARALGRWKYRPLGRFHYWVDTGIVRGHETAIDFDDLGGGLSVVDSVDRRRVRGWAADLGVTWETKFRGAPSFTFGFARGSGDSDGGTDTAYRQTGLQDNNTKFRGVDRFRYYGELLRPELSNLDIYTLSVGFPLLAHSSIEIPFHVYRQVEASDRLRNARLRIDPDGLSRDIGSELDIVLGLEEWKHLELELVAGLFRAGDAFGARSGDYASTVIFKLNYNF